MHRDELMPRDAASFDLARTQRILRQVQLEQLDPSETTRRTAAIMNEGNNARLSGGWELAREKYKLAREQSPMHELSAKLYFNEASLRLLEGEKLDALNACYLALDQTLTVSLEGDVYAMIAELELELGQPDKAITAAARGLRRAQDRDVTGRCVMMLARAYLLDDDPDSANRVLFEQSQNLSVESQRRIASVFGSYSRYQRMPSRGGLQDEGQRLVMSLAQLRPSDIDGFADALIVSQAYASVGLRTSTIESLQKALADAPEGFWAERIRFELAKAHYEAGQLQQANETIEGYGQVSMDLLPAVLMLHANVKYDAHDFDGCEAVCRRILGLDKIDEALQSDALNKLGNVLNEKGDHYAATLCFAGLLPEPSQDTNSSRTVVE